MRMDTCNQITHPQISIAIPTHCRFQLLLESFQNVILDPRVREIVISDDCSRDGSFERLVGHFGKDRESKVKIYRNKSNVDCYRNKRQAVELATSEWVILFDDDNVIRKNYLDVLYNLPVWDERTLYCPDHAQPHFNYTAFAGQTFDRKNVASFLTRPHFKTALNTANYFFNRASYLEVWDGSVDPVTADSLFHAYNWLVWGGKIIVVPGLRYFHRVHEGSHYKRNFKRTGDFAHRLDTKLRLLK